MPGRMDSRLDLSGCRCPGAMEVYYAGYVVSSPASIGMNCRRQLGTYTSTDGDPAAWVRAAGPSTQVL